MQTVLPRYTHYACTQSPGHPPHLTAHSINLPPLLLTLREDQPSVWYTPKPCTPDAVPWATGGAAIEAWRAPDALLVDLPGTANEYMMVGEYLPSVFNLLCAHLGRGAFGGKLL